MRKLLGFVILVFLLSACNFSGQPPTSVPNADLVSTEVALALTKMPTATKPVPATLIPPTVTPPRPTATVVTATLTKTTTPTADVKATLGSPVWKDTFANGKGWGLEGSPYDDGNTKISIKNNAMVLVSVPANGWHGWRSTFQKPKDMLLEAVIQTQTCSGSDLYGLMFRTNTSSEGYWFGVTCDGRFNLRKGGINAFEEGLKMTASSAIQAGANQTNRLGVLANGNKLSLYANGKLLGELTDSTYPNAGTFGLFIAGYKTANFTVLTTEVAYWNLK